MARKGMAIGGAAPAAGFIDWRDGECLQAHLRGRGAPEGFRSRRARFHYADEELVIVLSGRPSLRTPDGIPELEEGEALRFPLGEEGAHQILNRTDETATFLAISSHGRPDVVVYPDSDKIGFGERLPRGGGLRAFFRRSDGVDYFEGEQPHRD